MYNVEPQGVLYLCKTPLESDLKNTLTFANKQAQLNYFNSKVAFDLSDDNYTFIRENNSIKVDKNIEDIRTCNYLFYNNKGFTNKIFYCFITEMNYINENCTQIIFTTDSFQTWQFDIVYKPCYVEREHVNDDTIGIHTIPEDLETGEYIVNSVYVDSNLDNIFNDTTYIMGASVDFAKLVNDKYEFSGGGTYQGIYSGVTYYSFPKTSSGQTSINAFLASIASKGQSDTITGLFIAPTFLVPNYNSGVGYQKIENSNSPVSYNISVSKSYGLNGYVPKNNKLYTHPYCYLVGSNSGGTANIYRYEDFSNTNCTFNVKAVLCPGASIRCVPTNYKGATQNDMESLMLGKYPICNYSVDMYTNWQTQNSVNVLGNTITSDDINIGKAGVNVLAGVAGGIAVGGILGGIAGAFTGAPEIANTLMAKKQHELIPPSVRGDLNSGDVLTASSKNNFRFYRMSIKAEYARQIDNYFSMFGYQVNVTKIPNITGRANWNYVKTINCNFDGDIPQKDIQIIRGMFNTGITLWHNPNIMYDYTQNNGIV